MTASSHTAVTERAILFGSHRGLVGVVTQPATVPGSVETPRRAIVMANIGLSHHVGPFRLYVDLARAVAALGWYALRFDLSGLGDSLPRSGARTSGEQATLDVREALDWLETHLGVREVVLVGLCSGVDTMHPVMVADPRVIGAVFVDGYTYPTLGYYVRRHTLRYFQVERWQRFVRRRAHGQPAQRGPSDDTVDTPQPVFQREYPARVRFRADVEAVAARGTRLLFVFTGTFDVRFNSEGQMAAVLGRVARSDAVAVRRFPKADHLFSGVEHRAALFACVQAWIAGFPAVRGA